MSKEAWTILGHPSVWECVIEVQADEDYVCLDHDALLKRALAHAEGVAECLAEGDEGTALFHLGYLFGCRELVHAKGYAERHGFWNIPLGHEIRNIAERATELMWPSFEKKVGTYKPWYERYGTK